MSTGARHGRRRWVIGTLAVLVLAGVAGSRPLLRKEERAETPPRFSAAAAEATPASYRVVYRVTDTVRSRTSVSTDVLQVRRPFEARLEHREGAPPGGEAQSTVVTNARYVYHSAPTARTFATGRIPGPLSQAVSLEALQAAVSAGVAERLGQGTVAGEQCVRFRYRTSDDQPLAEATRSDHVETCVAPDGILLRQSITISGRQLRVSEAVDVQRSPAFAPGTFLEGGSPEQSGAALIETEQLVTEGADPSSARLVPVVPPRGFAGFRQVTVQRSPGGSSPPLAFSVRSFVKGPDIVAVDEVLTAASDPPWPLFEGRLVKLDGGRETRVVYLTSGAEVRLALDGRFLRVRSNRPAVALATARRLGSEVSEP